MTKRLVISESSYDGPASFEEATGREYDYQIVVDVPDDVFERWTKAEAEWRRVETEIEALCDQDWKRRAEDRQSEAEAKPLQELNSGVVICRVGLNEILRDGSGELLELAGKIHTGNKDEAPHA